MSKILTPQQVFDRVVAHARTQGRAARRHTTYFSNCMRSMWGINNRYTNEWWRDDDGRILKFATKSEAGDYVWNCRHEIDLDADESSVQELTPEDLL